MARRLTPRRIGWRGLDSPTVEVCTVTQGTAGVRACGEVVGGDRRIAYDLRAEADWSFRSVVLRSEDGVVAVERGPAGWRVDGIPRADLQAAVEVDISATPLTNTLPIRRLRLAIGETREIVTAYINAAALDAAVLAADSSSPAVFADPQRYTRTGPRRFLYESLDSDFRRELLVDGDGLVLEYPGLFTRVEPGATRRGAS